MGDGGADRSVYGLRVRSEVELDDLACWRGDDRPPDVTIRIGDVPPGLDDVVFSNAFVTIGAAGLVRYEVPGVGTCLIDTAGSLVIQPAAGAPREALRTLIDGGPLSIACFRRGWLPMHASSIDVDGRAVVLAGASGAGKSTTAAALLQRGHRVFADDVSVVQPWRVEGPVVFPGFPHMKLCPDAAAQGDWPAERLEPLRLGAEKLRLAIHETQQREPRPVGLLLVLNGGAGVATPVIRLLSGAPALAAVRYATYRPRLPEVLGLAESLLAASTKMARRVPVGLLDFTKHESTPHDLAACIERALEDRNAAV